MLNWVHPKRDDTINTLLEDEFVVTSVPGMKHILAFIDGQMYDKSKFLLFADFENSHLLAQQMCLIGSYYLPSKFSTTVYGYDTRIIWIEDDHYLIKDKYSGILSDQINNGLKIRPVY